MAQLLIQAPVACYLPKLHLSVETGRCQEFAIRREHQGADASVMSTQDASGPQLDPLVGTAGCQRLGFPGNRHGIDGAFMPAKNLRLLPGGQVPAPCRSIRTAAGKRFAVAAKRQGVDRPRVPLKRASFRAGGGVPQPDRPVVPG